MSSAELLKAQLISLGVDSQSADDAAQLTPDLDEASAGLQSVAAPAGTSCRATSCLRNSPALTTNQSALLTEARAYGAVAWAQALQLLGRRPDGQVAEDAAHWRECYSVPQQRLYHHNRLTGAFLVVIMIWISKS